ncbi:hypothetical protein LshimejAT787_0903870 [Lyophyllum shimeji]|uniref:Uncharacterized protein n=1 Tax=Lyophyllum shimeji TaxID=47721 RepID=A0A9P3UQD8_LYOSH|nr:hypothetical protein LshimejAT787_0903870 [Lyophyllum shimeji]
MLPLRRKPSADDYGTFSTMPRTTNHYLPILRNLAATSFTSLGSPLSPVSPTCSRRASPKKTPSPQRKSRSSTSTSVFGKVVEKLKINPKGRAKTASGPAPKSPLRSPGLRGKRSFSGVGMWEEHSPQRLHQERLAELRRLRTARRAIEMEMEDGDDQAQYLTTRGADPFKTPPCTPTDAVLLSPVEMNLEGSPDSARSRRRQTERAVQVQRSGMKLLQTLGLDAREAVLEQCRKALEV